MTHASRLKSAASAALSVFSLSFLSLVVRESPQTASAHLSDTLPSGFTDGWGLLWAAFWVALCFLYARPLVRSRPCAVLAAFLSLFTVGGANLRFNNTLNFFTHSLPRAALTLLCVFGLFLLLRALLGALCSVLSHPVRAPFRLESVLFDRRAFLFPFLCIFLCYLPYLIVFFPGTVHWDALWQLNFFTGQWTFTTHHPPFSTLLMGACLRVGQMLKSDNWGVFCYVFPQSVLCALVFSSVFPLLRDLHSPYCLRWGALFFFALFPLCPIFAVTLTKDTSFALASLALSILTFRLFLLPDSFTRPRAALLFLCALLMCLTRNNGFPQVLLCLIVFIPLLFSRRLRVLVSAALGGALAVSLIFSRLIVPALGILPGDAAEAMSIPLQQTARTALCFPADITPSEREAIDAVVPYDQLADAYLPEKADGVKSLVRSGVTGEQWIAYLRAWLSQLTRHPFTYIEATLNNIYGYLYPDRTPSLDGLGYYDIEHSEGIYLGNLDLYFLPAFSQARYRLSQLAQTVQSLPVVGMLYSCGAHVWALLICACMLFNARKTRLLGALVPAFSCVLVCFASPVNAYIRYLLPVMYALPLTAALIVYSTQKEAVPHETRCLSGSSL